MYIQIYIYIHIYIYINMYIYNICIYIYIYMYIYDSVLYIHMKSRTQKNTIIKKPSRSDHVTDSPQV